MRQRFHGQEGQGHDPLGSGSLCLSLIHILKRIYLFNEEYGYGVMVWSESDLPAEEVIKVAEGLKIEVLDETVAYMTDEELKKLEADQEADKQNSTRTVSYTHLDKVQTVLKKPTCILPRILQRHMSCLLYTSRCV